MADVGRPSELTEELLVKIKQCVLEGKNHKETAEIIEVPYDTYEGWIKRNYDNFADSLLTYKHERLLNKAERNLEQFLDMETINHGMTMKGQVYEYTDPKLEQVKSSVSMFVSETIGRRNYHKKIENEQTGDPIQVEVIYGKEGTNRLLSESTSPVAREGAEPVGGDPVQDTSGGTQSP